MKKTWLALLLGATLALFAVACTPAAQEGGSGSSASATPEAASSVEAEAESSVEAEAPAAQPSEEELATLMVDEAAKTITVYGQVNGKYFTEETHHFLVNKDGSNGEKAVLRAWAQPADFYDALIKLGGTPGDNLEMDSAKGKFIEGSKIKVTLSWDGSNGEVPYEDCIKTKDGSPWQADIRFGGNLETNNEKGTGCLSCLFSCPVGITSNAAYPYGSDDVFANADVLPEDGTFVKVTFTLLEDEAAAAPAEAKTQSGTVTTKINMTGYDAGKQVRVWVPVATNGDFQTVSDEAIEVEGATTAEITEDALGNKMAYIEWPADADPAMRMAKVSFHAQRTEAVRPELKEEGEVPADIAANYLGSSSMVKVDDPEIVKLAGNITEGKTTMLEKARAIYDWIYENMNRDNDVIGCGDGDVCRLITPEVLSGKCTDINSVFVALCRASGVPAQEMFGIRMNEANITGNQHCWCEFYLPGTGWVPADPADVLKAILTDELDKASQEALDKKEYYWGQWDEKRVEYSHGRDITLAPAQAGPALNDFGYPYAEIDGEVVDFYKPEEFVYSVSFLSDDARDAGVSELGVPMNYMTPEEVQAVIESGDDSKVILDLRKDEDAQAAHLAGSIYANMDPAVSSNDYATALANMNAALAEAGKDKDLILVCYGGKKYAQAATDVLNALGYDLSKVYTLQGGFGAWTEANMPTES